MPPCLLAVELGTLVAKDMVQGFGEAMSWVRQISVVVMLRKSIILVRSELEWERCMVISLRHDRYTIR